MQLSRRLKAVANSVTKGCRVADIGCDHAYISIYLIGNDIAPSVIAMDVNKGPLKRAVANIKTCGYEDRIVTRLSDGLHELKPKEVDSILIAGMGGVLMVRILEEGKEVVGEVEELILQPQSEIAGVRKYLHAIGFGIRQEQMLKEDGKYYIVMKAVRLKYNENQKPANKLEHYEKQTFYQYGKLLLEERNPTLYEYLEQEARKKKEVIKELTSNSSMKSIMRLKEMEEEMKYIEEAKSYYIETP